jgi:cellulose synthase/poly-beta-1,6-N-acetylglucosamine synthase-like glycosyltransferase
MLSILLIAGYALLMALLLVHASVTLAWMLYTWRSPEAANDAGFVMIRRRPKHSFSLLVPARHEEEVLGETLDRLAASNYPDFEILAIIGHDDHGTREIAEAAARRHPELIRVITDHSWPKNKPKALNTALTHARGEVVGVFDAEDEVHAWLLRAVDHQFRVSRADVVQAGVQLVNFWSNWYSVRNVLEYFFWFKSRLHLHARRGFIPLGGNTVFVRRAWLEKIGGWDPDSLTEDCDLGVRLSLAGARFTVAYEPDFITREETPTSFLGWLKQRTRWNQGFLQVLRKGDWRKLSDRRRRLLAWYTLANPFIQAATGVLIPLAVLTILWGGFPVWLAILTFLPVLPTLATLIVEVVALGELSSSLDRKARARDYVRLVLGSFAYQLALALAAIRALFREMTGDQSWEKTDHVGGHRDAARATAEGYSFVD